MATQVECAKCGGARQEDTRFCGFCGAEFPSESSAPVLNQNINVNVSTSPQTFAESSQHARNDTEHRQAEFPPGLAPVLMVAAGAVVLILFIALMVKILPAVGSAQQPGGQRQSNTPAKPVVVPTVTDDSVKAIGSNDGSIEADRIKKAISELPKDGDYHVLNGKALGVLDESVSGSLIRLDGILTALDVDGFMVSPVHNAQFPEPSKFETRVEIPTMG